MSRLKRGTFTALLALYSIRNGQRQVALQQCELTAEALPRRATTAFIGRQTADEPRETAVCDPPSAVFARWAQFTGSSP